MAQAVRIWFKKQMRLDRLTFQQREMVTIGAAGLLDVKRRVSQARNITDSPAKPLARYYAIWKSKQHRGRWRDLKLTGKMLGNFTLRTVGDNIARASLTSRKERIKADANNKRELWIAFSPANKQAVWNAAQKLIPDRIRRLVVSKKTGIDLG